MRHSNARLSIWAAIAMAALSGCKDKEAAPPPSQAEESNPAAAESGTARPKREKQAIFRARGESVRARLGLLELTYEEIQGLVPTLASAVQVSTPNVQTGGRQVNVVHCVTGDDIGKIEAELREKLQAVGFDSIESRDKKPVGRLPKDLLTLIAQKPPYRVTIAARKAPFFDCRADEKKVKLVMSFFKRADKAKAPGSSTAAGPESSPSE